jgi:DNA repair protein RadD
MQLREYQQQAVDAIIADFHVPGNSVCVAATGAGKSLIIAEVAHRIAPEPLLILSPSKEITEQNLAKLSIHFSEVGVFSASMGSKTIKQVTLATIGSVYQTPELFTQFKHVLIDEAHTVSADDDYTMYMKFLNDIGVPKVVGLTATPFRMSHTYLPPTYNKIATCTKVITRMRGKREEIFWNRIIVNITTEFLIERGYLCKPTYFDNSTITHEHIPTNKSASDFNLDAYAEMILPDEENYIHTIKRLGDVSKSVLVFCLSVDQATRFANAIVGGAVVSALTPKKERERIIAGFRDHTIKYVFNVATMTTGFDHPALDGIVLIRPTRSLALYSQMVGRGMRIAPEKETCRVIDFSGTVKSIGHAESIKIVQRGRSWELESSRCRNWHGKTLYLFER